MILLQFNDLQEPSESYNHQLAGRLVVRGNSESLILMASSPSILLSIQHVRNLIKYSFKHRIDNKAGLGKVVVIYRKYL